MYLATKLYSYFFGKYVGQDQFGNRYYYLPAKKTRSTEKRWVVYNGLVEASKIPSAWHAWLHHVSNQLPTQETAEKYPWQKAHQPNYTGTKQAYHPQGSQPLKKIKAKHYQSWQPKKQNLGS